MSKKKIDLNAYLQKYMCCSTPCLYEEEYFFIVESWDAIETLMYALIEDICGENILFKYYNDRIKKCYGERPGIEYGNTRINGYVPDEINEAFIQAGLIKKGQAACFEDIIDSDWGFAGEYTHCSGCENAIRLTPDSAGWIAKYFNTGSEMFCEECVHENPVIQQEYIEFITNNSRIPNTILNAREMKANGFILYTEEAEPQTYHGGFNGYSADPETQLKELLQQYHYVIFDLTSATPFDAYWQIWVKDQKANIVL